MNSLVSLIVAYHICVKVCYGYNVPFTQVRQTDERMTSNLLVISSSSSCVACTTRGA